jgi:hypothetical protein
MASLLRGCIAPKRRKSDAEKSLQKTLAVVRYRTAFRFLGLGVGRLLCGDKSYGRQAA